MIEYTEEQQLIIETAREFAVHEVRPAAERADKTHTFPIELYRKAWEIGLQNFSIPEEYGGLGLDSVTVAAVIEAIAWGCSGVATSIATNDLANFSIALFGTKEQKREWLQPFCERFGFASYCLTEPGAGSDNSAMKSRVKKGPDSNGYTLNGNKQFITNASHARQFTVVCKDAYGMSVVVVPVDSSCIRVGKPEDKLGQIASDTATVTFEGVPVSQHQFIGPRKLGFHTGIVATLQYARPMVASFAVGVAQAALDFALAFAKERVQFGAPIATRQLIQRLLVTMQSKVHQARLATQHAAWLCDRWMSDIQKHGLIEKMETGSAREQRAALEGILSLSTKHKLELYASLCKNAAAEAAKYCVSEGLQIHGGYGFMNEYPISKLYRDAPILDIYEGTNQIQTLVAARELVGD